MSGYKEISPEALQKELDDHECWLETGGEEGKPAEFDGTDLSAEKLTDLELMGANFRGAKLGDLSRSNLVGAIFDTTTDFSEANLSNTTVNLDDFRGKAVLSKMPRQKLPKALHNLWGEQTSASASLSLSATHTKKSAVPPQATSKTSPRKRTIWDDFSRLNGSRLSYGGNGPFESGLS